MHVIKHLGVRDNFKIIYKLIQGSMNVRNAKKITWKKLREMSTSKMEIVVRNN